MSGLSNFWLQQLNGEGLLYTHAKRYEQFSYNWLSFPNYTTKYRPIRNLVGLGRLIHHKSQRQEVLSTKLNLGDNEDQKDLIRCNKARARAKVQKWDNRKKK